MSSVERALQVQAKYTESLKKIPGVKGVGVSNGAIRVFVDSQEAARNVPSAIEGVPVKVTVGTISLRTYTDRVRPVLGGYSIGAGPTGTFSCLVRDNKTGKLLGLSNAHVFGTKYGSFPGSIGQAVVQPGQYDGGVEPNDVVGKVIFGYPVKLTGGNIVDAALMEPTSQTICSRLITKLNVIPINPIDPTLHMHVAKSGRTTETTYGEVMAINTSITVCTAVDAEGNCVGDEIDFDQTFGVQCYPNRKQLFSDHGDSGSLILEDKTNYPVGLLFAGGTDDVTGEEWTFAVYAKNVARLLNVSFLAPATYASAMFIPAFAMSLGVGAALLHK